MVMHPSPVTPQTEAGRVTTERLRDLFASWESRAEYHNIATDELDDPLPLILAIEREAADAARKEVRPAMWELVHDAAHAGDGYYETCMECMRSVDAILDWSAKDED